MTTNRSSVWTPLVHAVWMPDPKGRDQVRFSLTRSYRSPTLANLIARPSVNTRYPVPGPNTPTQPDRAGNPNLKPELAQGGLDMVVRTDRNAAADDRGVGAERALDRVPGRAGLVRTALHRHDLRSRPPRQGGHGVGVRVADTARPHRLVGAEELHRLARLILDGGAR